MKSRRLEGDCWQLQIETEVDNQVEVWVMIHDANRVTGIGWPVRWTYTTRQAIDELDARTRREWAASRSE